MAELFSNLPAQTRPLRELPAGYVKTSWAPPETLPRLGGWKRLGIDVETKDPQISELGPGCRRPGNFIAGISLADGMGTKMYLPIRHEGGGNLPASMVLGWAREELNAYRGEVVGANLIYDLDWLANERITFPNVKKFLDVQIAEPLLDENRLSYSLETLAKEYLGEGKKTAALAQVAAAYRWKTDKQLKENLWKLPAAIVGEYAEEDAALPLRILHEQEKRLKAEDLEGVFDMESDLIPVLLAMRRRGVPIDLRRAEAAKVVLERELRKWTAKLKYLAGPKAELMQPESLGPSLEKRGLAVRRTLKKEYYSIDAAFLEYNQGDELVDAIAAGRRVNTLINTFINGHVLGHQINGRIHCQFNQLKGENGGTPARLSSSDPNLQNLPSREKNFDEQLQLGEDVVQLIRGIFNPEKGEEWEQQDQSQMEYRFLVHYAVGDGADEARAAYNNDPATDFHKLCAKFMGADPNDSQKRKLVKIVNFAKGYGAGAGKIATIMRCPIQEAERFIKQYEEALPFTLDTYREAGNLAKRRGYVKTILKRRQRFPLWEPRGNKHEVPPLPLELAKDRYKNHAPLVRAYTYKALNRMLQGSNADLMKKAMVDNWKAGICNVLGPPLLTVHDELDWSVPKTKEGDEAAKEAKRLTETAIRIKVPIMVTAKRAADWGACG